MGSGGLRGRQIVLHDHKIAFFTVPKCASMSVCASFEAALGDEWRELLVLHPDKPILWDGWQEYDRYAIVRDPIKRFLSGRAFLMPNRNVRDLVQEVITTPDADLDQHFRSQSSFLTVGGELIPNKLIRFESLPEAWPFPQWPLHHRNMTGEKPKLEADLVEALAERFADDFKLLEQIA